MVQDTYKTIADVSEGLYTEKRSKFIAVALPVKTVEEIKEHLEVYQKKYYDARHVCYAYMLGHERKDFRANDNGEPSGTAGKPILGQINSNELTDILVIVVRYFGGIKLGAGGLTRAYAGSAQAAVDEMVLLPYVPMAQVQILAEFATEAQCRYVVESLHGRIDDVNYSKQVTLTVTLAEADIDRLKERLAMDGRVLDNS